MEPEIMFSRCGITLGVTIDGVYFIDEGFGFEEIPADTEAQAVAYLESIVAGDEQEEPQMNIYINAKRNGYDQEQCGNTMTVGELIEFLQQFDDEIPVYLKHDGGCTYGSITELDFEEGE